MLGVNLRKAVGAAAELAVVPAERGALLEVLCLHQRELVGAQDVGSHAEDAARLHGNRLVVAGDHLHGDAKVVGAVDGVLGVGSGRVEEGEDTDKLEGSVGGAHGARDREGADAAVCELHNLGLDLSRNLRLVVAHVQHDVGRTLGHLHPLTRLLVHHGRLRALDRGIEGHVVRLVVVVEGTNVNRVEHEGVERILGGLPPLGGERRELEHVVPAQTLDEDGKIFLKHHLVEGQGARLVGAEDGHARELLDGGEARDDGLLGGELVATQGEGRGAHDTQGDGDGGDEEDDVEREHLPEVDADVEQVAKHDETDDGTRGDQDDHDLAEHLLKVSELVHALHEVRGLAEEGLGAGGGDGGLDLAAGHRRSHLGLGSGVHRHRERFASERRLVNLDGLSLAEDAVGRDRAARAEAHDITGDQLRRVHVVDAAPALHGSLGLERLAQRGDGVAGFELLDEADEDVEELEDDEDDDVDPRVAGVLAAAGFEERLEGLDRDRGPDHQGHRLDKLEEELPPDVLLLLAQLIVPEAREAVRRLRLGQALLGSVQELRLGDAHVEVGVILLEIAGPAVGVGLAGHRVLPVLRAG